MVLSGFELAVLVLLPLVLGGALLRAIGIEFRTDRVGFVGWSWMLGSLFVAALELARLLTGLGSPGPLAASGLVLAGLLAMLGRRHPPLPPQRADASEHWQARAFFGVMLGFALAVCAQRVVLGNWEAIVRDDEALFWSKRAKLWFQADGMGGVYARTLAAGELPNADYPLLNPLLQLWAFDLAGRITHVVNRLPLQLCSLALLLCTASALRRAAGPILAGALLILLVSTPAAAYATRHASGDVLMALGGVVALDAFLRWSAGGTRAWLRLASLALAFLVFSKNEGLLFVAAFLVAWGFEHRRRARELLRARAWLLPWWLPALCALAITTLHNRWFRTVTYHSPLTGSSSGFALDLLRDLPETLRAFGSAFLAPSLNYVFPAFFVLAVCVPAARRGSLGVVTRTLLLILAGLVFVYVAKPMDPARVLNNSLDRVLFQLVPLLLVWIACAAEELVAGRRRPAPEASPVRRAA